MPGLSPVLDVEAYRQQDAQDDDDRDREVHAEVAVAEHGEVRVHLAGVDAQVGQDQAGRDGDRGYEADGDRVSGPAVVVGAALDAFDRGQLGGDGGAEAFEHPAGPVGAIGQVHRFVEGFVVALDAERGQQQAEIGWGFDTVGQLQLQVSELVGDAFEASAAGLSAAADGFEIPEKAHVREGSLADSAQLCGCGYGLDGGEEDGVLDEVGVAAGHADERADRRQPSGAAVQFGWIPDDAVFLAVVLIAAVDQALDYVLTVFGCWGRAEDDLVTFGEEPLGAVGLGAELGGQGVRVIVGCTTADAHVSEVAVLEQVDHLEQLALDVQGQGRDDLAGGQAEEPDLGSGYPAGVLPALKAQRAGIEFFAAQGLRQLVGGQFVVGLEAPEPQVVRRVPVRGGLRKVPGGGVDVGDPHRLANGADSGGLVRPVLTLLRRSSRHAGNPSLATKTPARRIRPRRPPTRRRSA